MTDERPRVTADQLRALREVRFVTVNRSRSRAWAIDADKARVEATGMSALGYERAPRVWDYQGMSEHPDVIAAVEKRLGLDRG